MLNKEQLPVVALETMNTVHYEEVDLINALYAQVEAYTAGSVLPEAVDESLATLLAHMREHFAGEEALMREGGFPVYPVHKAEHDRVLREAQAIYQDWHVGRDLAALSTYLYQTLPTWLMNHISTMDTVTALFLSPLSTRTEE